MDDAEGVDIAQRRRHRALDPWARRAGTERWVGCQRRSWHVIQAYFDLTFTVTHLEQLDDTGMLGPTQDSGLVPAPVRLFAGSRLNHDGTALLVGLDARWGTHAASIESC